MVATELKLSEVTVNLGHHSNQTLHTQTVSRAEQERSATLEVLWHLKENERRMLYAEMGYRDLKEYCVKELKYSEGSAWRRISAMRLLKEVPEVEDKIQSGDLNLTQISLARSHFREVKSTLPEKKEILLSLENQSIKSTERLLAERKPEELVARPVESEKPLRGQKLEVTFILDEELQKELEEIEILLGKPHSKLELFKLMTKRTLADLKKRKERNQKSVKVKESKVQDTAEAQQSKVQDSTDAQQVNNQTEECKAQPLGSQAAPISRHVPNPTRRQVEIRDQHRCQYRDPISGRQCEARFYLQAEHIVPFAKGGGHDLKNLELLCANHNRLRAVQQFGQRKMERHMNSNATGS